jgi:hypothetical protein
VIIHWHCSLNLNTMSITTVEEGTQGLHYCVLESFKDEETSEQEKQLVQQAIVTARALMTTLGSQSAIEEQLGAAPTDPELFSLWFTSLTPMSEREKVIQLRSQNTLQRLRACMQAFEDYSRRVNNSAFGRISSLLASWFTGGGEAAMNLNEEDDGNESDDGEDDNDGIDAGENDDGSSTTQDSSS